AVPAGAVARAGPWSARARSAAGTPTSTPASCLPAGLSYNPLTPDSAVPSACRMRWSIIRLIWARELRDQLRDRRTLFMIAVLPLILYPVGGLGLMYLALGFLGQTNPVRVVGHRHL